MEGLDAVLAAEAAELGALIPLLEDQHRALVRADAGAVGELLQRQEPRLRALAALEAERRACLERLAARLGADPAALTLSRLRELLPASAPRLDRPAAELRAALDRLGALTRRNAFLLARARGHLGRLLEAVRAALVLEPAPTYAAGGRAAAAGPLRRLVDREV